METRFYYGIVDRDEFGNLVCTGTLNTFEEKTDSNYIPMEEYDDGIVGCKMWTGSEWVDNPNYIALVEE